MKVVMDEKIPYLREALLQMGMEVVALPGVAICRADVSDADALFVRTRTLCGKDLLEGSHVKFIGTATIGHDHIDSTYCADNGIYGAMQPVAMPMPSSNMCSLLSINGLWSVDVHLPGSRWAWSVSEK